VLESLIKEWYNPRDYLQRRGYIPWVGQVERKRDGGVGIVVGKTSGLWEN
jgi:hypothetical protein